MISEEWMSDEGFKRMVELRSSIDANNVAQYRKQAIWAERRGDMKKAAHYTAKANAIADKMESAR